MKKKILSLGLLTIVLFTSSCSMFDNFKNKTGTFSEDLVIKEFTNQDKLVLLAGAESNYIEKANENNVLLYDEENSYKYRYFRNADGARVRLQVFLAKKSSEDDLTSYKTDDVIDYQKEGTDPNFTYKMEHYRSGYVIDSNYNLSKEEYDNQRTLNKAMLYKYSYEDDKDNLDLMFASLDDPNQTIDSILNYIISKQGNFDNLTSWSAFLEEIQEKCQAGRSGDKEITVSSWRRFNRIIRKLIYRNPIFDRIHDYNEETRIGEALKHIKKNEVHVIDIAKLNEGMQGFVFGDAIRTIYNLQLGEYSGEKNVNPPRKIIIFIDELNKYASQDSPKNSPILQQILDIAERGRSLGIILFSAEQFRSAIHSRVTGNCSSHAYGRTNAIEIAKSDYKYVPQVYKNMMTRLKQGEYIIQNPIFRSLLNIKFPKPLYKQYK